MHVCLHAAFPYAICKQHACRLYVHGDLCVGGLAKASVACRKACHRHD